MSGDLGLAARLSAVLGPGHEVAAVATVSSGDTRSAVLGAGSEADFEIGSISKGITGMLYCEGLARGEIDPSTTLSDVLPLTSTPVAHLALASLSTHRSGLPRLPTSAHTLRRSLELWRFGSNPYGEDLAALLGQARDVHVGAPTPRYSNFGFELLGHALAHATGTSYRHLVDERIAKPLGLGSLYAPADREELRSTSLIGRNRRGRPRAPWTGEAIAPAGGLRASITDMARLTEALLDGSAPGRAALRPVVSFGRGAAIGAAWITIEHRGRAITWHNGGTGGFRSWMGLDLKAGAGVVLLSARSVSVDRPGIRMLLELVGDRA